MRTDNHKQCRLIRLLAKKLRTTVDKAAMWWVESGMAEKWRNRQGDSNDA